MLEIIVLMYNLVPYSRSTLFLRSCSWTYCCQHGPPAVAPGDRAQPWHCRMAASWEQVQALPSHSQSHLREAAAEMWVCCGGSYLGLGPPLLWDHARQRMWTPFLLPSSALGLPQLCPTRAVCQGLLLWGAQHPTRACAPLRDHPGGCFTLIDIGTWEDYPSAAVGCWPAHPR